MDELRAGAEEADMRHWKETPLIHSERENLQYIDDATGESMAFVIQIDKTCVPEGVTYLNRQGCAWHAYVGGDVNRHSIQQTKDDAIDWVEDWVWRA